MSARGDHGRNCAMNDCSPEELLLKARARELAIIPPKPVRDMEGYDVMVFTLANEHYGIETTYVREVFPVAALTPIPCTPRYVAGMINVRGDIIGVFDLKAYFEFPPAESSVPGEIIILEMGDSLFGILADSAIGVSFIPLSDLQGTPPSLSGIQEASFKGVASGPLIVLDIPRMLVDKKLWVHEEVST